MTLARPSSSAATRDTMATLIASEMSGNTAGELSKNDTDTCGSRNNNSNNNVGNYTNDRSARGRNGVAVNAEVICTHSSRAASDTNNRRIFSTRVRKTLSGDTNTAIKTARGACRPAATAGGNRAPPRKRQTRQAGGWWGGRQSISSLLVVLLMCLNLCDFTTAAIKNMELLIEPPAVKRGQSVTLRCLYALENETLYSVKFYRGSLDFFRYTPGDKNQTIKVLHFPGIKVDEKASNGTRVVLRNVTFGLTGNFSCEVTCDLPTFSTATAYAQMHVVEFPEKRPQLFTENIRYEPGQTLRANCSTPPSRPRAELRFTINNMPASTGETQYIRTVDNLIASRLSLKLVLQSVHFTSGGNSHMINALGSGGGPGSGGSALGVPYSTHNANGHSSGGGVATTTTGSLLLRCTAQIGDLYQEYKEIELGTPQRDPVPARVTLSAGTGLRNFFDRYFSSSNAATLTRTMRTPIQLCSIVSMTAMAIAALHWLRLCPSSASS